MTRKLEQFAGGALRVVGGNRGVSLDRAHSLSQAPKIAVRGSRGRDLGLSGVPCHVESADSGLLTMTNCATPSHQGQLSSERKGCSAMARKRYQKGTLLKQGAGSRNGSVSIEKMSWIVSGQFAAFSERYSLAQCGSYRRGSWRSGVLTFCYLESMLRRTVRAARPLSASLSNSGSVMLWRCRNHPLAKRWNRICGAISFQNWEESGSKKFASKRFSSSCLIWRERFPVTRC